MVIAAEILSKALDTRFIVNYPAGVSRRHTTVFLCLILAHLPFQRVELRIKQFSMSPLIKVPQT
jgi:hypothetical protein